MSEVAEPGPAPAFSARAILALVVVGIVAFAGLSVLAAFAPDLRSGNDGKTAHGVFQEVIP